MRVLVLNSGSSSVKFHVVGPALRSTLKAETSRPARGLIDRIGGEGTCTVLVDGGAPHRETVSIRNHEEAVLKVFAWLDAHDGGTLRKVDAVGHRVVHGGDRFATPVLIDGAVIAAIEGLNELAPLHNPASVSGIRAARATLGPGVPMVAVFDTAFHRTLPGRPGPRDGGGRRTDQRR
ncbi:MAG: hypothetical protein ACE5JD_00850 [Candidatus Methylomirabilia bacterium]